MDIQLCTPQVLRLSSESQIRAGTYTFQPVDIDQVQDSTDLLRIIRSQPDGQEPADGIWHNLATTPPIEYRLGHIPVEVISWREIEILTMGRSTSSIEVVCRVDLSRMPPNHPKVFESPPSTPSILRRLRKWGRKTRNPDSSCSTQRSAGKCLARVEDTSRFVLGIRGCVLLLILSAVFLALSLFLGIFFTLMKSYGYSMGDAWTLASYIIGVGTIFTSVLGFAHYPNCNCWGKSKDKICTE